MEDLALAIGQVAYHLAFGLFHLALSPLPERRAFGGELRPQDTAVIGVALTLDEAEILEPRDEGLGGLWGHGDGPGECRVRRSGRPEDRGQHAQLRHVEATTAQALIEMRLRRTLRGGNQISRGSNHPGR